MKKVRLTKQIVRFRPGISLVEVIMVLGISSMMIGGALVWFDTRKSSDFYDQMRQLESRIREVQSQNITSIVPGYTKDDAAGTGCNSVARTGCVIGQGEEVYATAVSMAVNAVNTGGPQLKIWYLKRTAPEGLLPQAEKIDDYNVETVDLPVNMRFEGYKVFQPNNNSDLSCAAPAGLNGYRNLPHQEAVSSYGERSVTAQASETLMVFRRTTGGYNAFNNPAGAIDFTPTTVSPIPSDRPTWNAGAVPNPSWRGNYDDSGYQYANAPNPANIVASQGRLVSQPCAVLWRFGSLERKAGSPGEPRFTAEINFNLVDGTTTLVTR